MKTGDIILADFPFSDFSDSKVRPAVVVAEMPDVYGDIIVCQISSVVPSQLNRFEVLLYPNSQNGLRAASIIKIHKIATVSASRVLTTIGVLSREDLKIFTSTFQALVS